MELLVISKIIYLQGQKYKIEVHTHAQIDQMHSGLNFLFYKVFYFFYSISYVTSSFDPSHAHIHNMVHYFQFFCLFILFFFLKITKTKLYTENYLHTKHIWVLCCMQKKNKKWIKLYVAGSEGIIITRVCLRFLEIILV